MAIDGIYDIGTISVNAGATAVTGVGTAWTTVGITAGDKFEAGGLIGLVESVTDNTHLTLTRAWPGASNLSGVGYQIIEDSWLRNAISTAQRQIGRIVNILNGTGYIYPVAAGGTPDNSLGEDGQYALDIEYGIWRKKAGGIWGSPYKVNYFAAGSTTANRVPKFTDANGTIGQSGVTIDSSNNVTGITTLLATCSDLAAGGGWSNGVKVTGSYPTFWAHDDVTNSGFIFAPYNGAWFQVETGGTIGALAIALDNVNGKVGIGGVSIPTAYLHSQTSTRLAHLGSGAVQSDASGNLSVSSDERLKHIDGEFTRSIEALRQISPIVYRWNELSEMDQINSYVGFSAQNVQAGIPEAVGSDDRGFLTFSDRVLLATIVNAIKSIDTRLTAAGY